MLKDWVVLQLGSRNCGRAPHSLRRTVKNLSDGFKLCVAERNILAHAYVVNKKHGDLLLHQCRMGKTSDNMLQAVQNACLRKNAALVIQCDRHWLCNQNSRLPLHANFLLGSLLAQAQLVLNICYLQMIEDFRKSTNENLQT